MKALVPDDQVVLDVTGSDLANGFYDIHGLKVDSQANDMTVLKNVDTGDGKVHVRFTDAVFVRTSMHQEVAHVDIDRSGSTNGQTVLEFVGCKGLAAGGGVLTNKVVIEGASSSKKSRLIVRDSQLPELSNLIAPSSSDFTENRFKNWAFADGLQPDT